MHVSIAATTRAILRAERLKSKPFDALALFQDLQNESRVRADDLGERPLNAGVCETNLALSKKRCTNAKLPKSALRSRVAGKPSQPVDRLDFGGGLCCVGNPAFHPAPDLPAAGRNPAPDHPTSSPADRTEWSRLTFASLVRVRIGESGGSTASPGSPHPALGRFAIFKNAHLDK